MCSLWRFAPPVVVTLHHFPAFVNKCGSMLAVGHSQIATTMNVYTHVTPHDQREANAKVRAVVEECIRFRKLSDHYPKFRMVAGRPLLHGSWCGSRANARDDRKVGTQ